MPATYRLARGPKRLILFAPAGLPVPGAAPWPFPWPINILWVGGPVNGGPVGS